MCQPDFMSIYMPKENTGPQILSDWSCTHWELPDVGAGIECWSSARAAISLNCKASLNSIPQFKI